MGRELAGVLGERFMSRFAAETGDSLLRKEPVQGAAPIPPFSDSVFLPDHNSRNVRAAAAGNG